MRKMLVGLTVAGASLFLAASAARADLIYGFETGDPAGPTDGFAPGSGPVTQSTVGVTQGSNSLEALPAQNTYYTEDALAATTYVPTALTLSNSATYSLTADASNFNYLQIFPTFDIEAPSSQGGTTEHFLSSDPSSQTNLGGQTLSGATILMNLAVFSDPDGASDGAGTSPIYTVGQIVANDSNYEQATFTVAAFQLDYQDSGTSDGSSVPFYFDAVTTPEPASLGLLGMGGVMLIRRRRPC